LGGGGGGENGLKGKPSRCYFFPGKTNLQRKGGSERREILRTMRCKKKKIGEGGL